MQKIRSEKFQSEIDMKSILKTHLEELGQAGVLQRAAALVRLHGGAVLEHHVRPTRGRACGKHHAGLRGGHEVQENERQFRGIQSVTKIIWSVLEPFLFSLIGSEITVKSLESSAAYGILCIFCALVVRLLVTVATCTGAGFSPKEKAFVAVSWIAKSTLQVCPSHILLLFTARLEDIRSFCVLCS
ncbi:hypothetical protein CEXT_410431 [Caerostris extrusa]|uniref:Cation/H+ exchanger transmembrane domain-containing protein n=1 Tax=Caerostris extrusa TaxID=172846 RepID=A0AAV4UMH9_CAEEX|nr:hypothetical protein CEXT_410431 [Caerostris extrusa]